MSSFEQTVDIALANAGIPHKWQERDGSLPIGDIHYKTDFILDLEYQGRRVIVEPHGGRYWNIEFLNKMKRFMNSEYRNKYHLIIIVDDSNEANHWLATNGTSQDHICHELWGENQLRSKHFKPRGFLKSKKARNKKRDNFGIAPKLIDSDGRLITEYGYETQKAIEFEFLLLKKRSLPWVNQIIKPRANSSLFVLRRFE